MKDEILERFKDYNPVVTLESDKCVSIEIKNESDDRLLINLEDEIILEFKDWHCHYTCEDHSDFEDAMEKVDNILNNRDCVITIYCNGKNYLNGSILDKSDYSEDDIVDFMDCFHLCNTEEEFVKYGVTAKLEFWDNSLDKEITVEKERFE